MTFNVKFKLIVSPTSSNTLNLSIDSKFKSVALIKVFKQRIDSLERQKRKQQKKPYKRQTFNVYFDKKRVCKFTEGKFNREINPKRWLSIKNHCLKIRLKLFHPNITFYAFKLFLTLKFSTQKK